MEKIIIELEVQAGKTREDVLVVAHNVAKACEEAYGIPALVNDNASA